MIFWKDFLLDDDLGAVLSPELFSGDSPVPTVCRRKRLGSPSVMDDARGTKTETASQDGGSIQETGQEQRPARMVGHSNLDSAQSHKDVSRGNRAQFRQQLRREG